MRWHLQRGWEKLSCLAHGACSLRFGDLILSVRRIHSWDLRTSCLLGSPVQSLHLYWDIICNTVALVNCQLRLYYQESVGSFTA